VSQLKKRRRGALVALGAGALGLGLLAQTAGAAPTLGITDVPTANTKAAGFPRPDALSPELTKFAVAQGNMALENPSGATSYYGYDVDPANPLPLLPAPGTTAEAQKTEPDKDTYLVLKGQAGADPNYDYGTHFLFQGHETGSPGYITRVNLDADTQHRVTLLANTDVNNVPLPSSIDGSTWDPFAKRLLLTAEAGAGGSVLQSTLDVHAQVQNLDGILGKAGYEGIQNDSLGNIYLVEDTGGSTDAVTKAKNPNSFVYRFVPTNRNDLTGGGKLQALQLANLAGNPFDASTFSGDVKDLHTYGKSFKTTWVTIHDTAVDGTTAFGANAVAKAKQATPFKRPENGVFRPGTNFGEFYFTETGDTNALSTANADFGGWGSVFVLHQAGPSATTGTLSLLFKGNQQHAGFDNITFLDRNHVAVVEDAGDLLHSQRNGLDSGYDFDVTHNYVDGAQPVRFLAQGRDPSATIDSGILGLSPVPADFHNEGDNELTGIHVSDGDPSAFGILGNKIPQPFRMTGPWRTFYTGQHGDNITWQIVRRTGGSPHFGDWTPEHDDQ
jgi:hypothetical protein